MSKRKTFDVASFQWHVNYFLKNSKPEQVAEREAQAGLLELVLSQTNNYSGFGHLELKNAGTPEQDLGDESRRMYYVAANLRDEYTAYDKMKTENGYAY